MPAARGAWARERAEGVSWAAGVSCAWQGLLDRSPGPAAAQRADGIRDSFCFHYSSFEVLTLLESTLVWLFFKQSFAQGYARP